MKHMKKIISVVTMCVVLVASAAAMNSNSVMVSKMDANAASSVSRQYQKYNCSTGAKEYYTLSMNEESVTNVSGAEIRGIIGSDDRVYSKREENNGIVKIGGGTGFVVGDHVIATAAHCVYNSDGFVGFHVRTYNADGSLTGEAFTPVEIHIPVEYANSIKPNATSAEKNKRIECDYALITVSEDLSNCTQFSLGTTYNMTSSSFSGIPIHVTGVDGKLMTGTGHISSAVEPSAGELTFDVDADYGQSGSPVYTVTLYNIGLDTYYEYTALAIHHGGGTIYNGGARVTAQVQKFFRGNSYINY